MDKKLVVCLVTLYFSRFQITLLLWCKVSIYFWITPHSRA